MTWTDLTFVDCSLLTAAKMTALQGNLTALAEQHAGAPVVRFPTSGPYGPVPASFGTIHAESGFLTPQVGSFGTVHVGSGMATPGVGSFGTVHAAAGLATPQVASLGTVHAGSGVLAPQVSSLGTLHVASAFLASNGLAVAGVNSFGTAEVSSTLSVLGGLRFPHFLLRFDPGNPPTITRQTNVSCLQRHSSGRYSLHLGAAFTNSAYYFWTHAGWFSGTPRILNVDPNSSTLSRVMVELLRNDGALADDTQGAVVVGFGD